MSSFNHAYFVALRLCLPVVLLTVFIKLPVPAISATVLTKPVTFATSSSPSYQQSGVANLAFFLGLVNACFRILLHLLSNFSCFLCEICLHERSCKESSDRLAQNVQRGGSVGGGRICSVLVEWERNHNVAVARSWLTCTAIVQLINLRNNQTYAALGTSVPACNVFPLKVCGPYVCSSCQLNGTYIVPLIPDNGRQSAS